MDNVRTLHFLGVVEHVGHMQSLLFKFLGTFIEILKLVCFTCLIAEQLSHFVQITGSEIRTRNIRIL